MTLIEAHGEAQDVAAETLAQAFFTVVEARKAMNWCDREPTLNGILSDSIVRDVMEADGINRHELGVMLRWAALRLRITRLGDESSEAEGRARFS
jgi:hypothetical protein